MISLGFWKSKYTKDFLSHSKGLTEEQVKQLQELKAGDRLIVYVNKKDSDNYPDCSLKVFKAKGDQK